MLKNKEKGFTIIEVVLVLAIAGLIFLVVFLALPALQQSQRDNARRQDVGKVVSAVQSYLADNKSQMPADGAAAANFAGYYGTLSQATSVTINSTAGTAGQSDSDTNINVQKGYDCSGQATSSRKAAVSIKLESSKAVYCSEV